MRRWAAGGVAVALTGLGASACTPPGRQGRLTDLVRHHRAAATFPHGLFDRRVTGRPVAADSKSMVADLVAQYRTYYGTVDVNQLPIIRVGPRQPAVSVNSSAGCGSFQASTGHVPIPAGASSTGSSDDPLVVYQAATHTDWELWRVSQAGGVWSACWGGRLSTHTSDGVFPSPYGLSASGISYLATTITEADIASGVIRHALALDVVRCNGHVAPAVRGDCGVDPGQPAEGTWFRMAPTATLPAASTPFTRMVFRALQTYGCVVTDHAGAVAFQAETAADWTAQGHRGPDPMTKSWAGKADYDVLAGLPIEDLQVISPPRA